MGALDRLVLGDERWARVARRIMGDERPRGSSGRGGRVFVGAVLWVVRTGSPRRDLPDVSGSWNSVFRRFRRRSAKGVWWRLLAAVSGDPDLERLIVDGTIVRAGQHAARARTGSEDRALGALSRRPEHEDHMAVRGLGWPVRLAVTAGQKGDAPRALGPIQNLPARAVLADAAHDGDPLRVAVAAKGALAGIPSNPSRAPRPFLDRPLRGERHLTECSSKPKQLRRAATRREKTARNHLVLAAIAAIVLWPR